MTTIKGAIIRKFKIIVYYCPPEISDASAISKCINVKNIIVKILYLKYLLFQLFLHCLILSIETFFCGAKIIQFYNNIVMPIQNHRFDYAYCIFSKTCRPITSTKFLILIKILWMKFDLSEVSVNNWSKQLDSVTAWQVKKINTMVFENCIFRETGLLMIQP